MNQTMTENSKVKYSGNPRKSSSAYTLDLTKAAFEPKAIRAALRDIDHPLYAIEQEGKIGLISATCDEATFRQQAGSHFITGIPALPIEDLGDTGFKKAYQVKCAYYAGSMANGIASVDLVIALGKAGLLGSFGAAGLGAQQIGIRDPGDQGCPP